MPDLDLHCLPLICLEVSSLQWVKYYVSYLFGSKVTSKSYFYIKWLDYLQIVTGKFEIRCKLKRMVNTPRKLIYVYFGGTVLAFIWIFVNFGMCHYLLEILTDLSVPNNKTV